MKILQFALYFLLACIFISCENDDDDGASVSGNIDGLWELSAVDYNGTITSESGGEVASGTFTGNGYDMDAVIQFNMDNTYNSTGSYSVALTLEFQGQTVTQNLEDQEFSGDGTWSQSGNTLAIDTDEVYEIKTLTDDTLIIAISASETTTDQGVTDTTELTVEFTFSRQ